MENKDENKVKFSEKISLNIRKKWLLNSTKTVLLVAILFAIYIALNLWITTLELPEIDVTENKIYTLSDTSKKAIETISQEVKIYAYGFEEDGQLIKLLKQYNEVNDKINYEILTEETNYQMVQENDLRNGYYVLIFESGNSKKIVDASTEFSSYDNITGQSIDTTEQTITNSILSLLIENKPKIYFTEGHGEFSISQDLNVLASYLQNESFEIQTINLATVASVPEDCAVLAIMSPASDLFEIERDMILNYINNGGNIYFSMDTLSETKETPNIKAVLSQYGVSFENGYIVELAEGKSFSKSPNVFIPQVSSTNPITADIYSDSRMWLAFAARLQFEPEETLQALQVEKEDLIYSSEESAYITDLTSDLSTALLTAEKGSSVIASIITKTLTTTGTDENSSEEAKKSVLVMSASGNFISDYKVPVEEFEQQPMSYLGSNKDFVINAMATLAEKENRITIRKDMASSTYTPTESQSKIVLAITFGVPTLIIIIGIIIWNHRKKRK